MPRTVELPYGEASLSFSLPGSWDVREARPRSATPAVSVEAAAREALAHPAAGPRLRDLARPGMTVTVAITDATRPSPDHLFLPLLLEELAAGGIREEDVTVLVALGMHRRTTPGERESKLGPAGRRLRVEEAQGAESAEYRDLGTLFPDAAELAVALPVPVPVHLHRRIVESDLVITTGIVEPHQYAGFSGGRKTVAIGCAGAETIRVLHGIAFLEHAGTRLGRLEDNAVHAALEAISRRAGLRFVLNVALDGDGSLVAAAAGEPGAVLATLTERLAPVTWIPVGPEPFDLVLAGVGAPKDANLYQASRALTYLAFSPAPVLRDGGWIVIPARCSEGAGQGPGEEEFLARMRAGASPEDVLRLLRRQGFGAGGQRAFMVARALARYRALVVGAEAPAVVTDCHMEAAPNPRAAVERMLAAVGENARVLIVPHALAVLPVRG